MIQFDFKEKVALVTGASMGIGRDVAIRFAESGAKVVIADTNENLGQEVVSYIKQNGGEATFISADVSNETEVTSMVEQTVKHYGRLNIACNNAGIEGEQAPTVDCSLENFDRTIAVNLRGVFLCMKAEIPEILKNGDEGGAILNLSSIAGLIGFPGLPAYVASKHAVAGLTKTAALEYATKNIRVNAICPGPIKTPMLERLMSSTPGFEEQIVAGVPEHRLGEPTEVANTILYLCSDEARYITGQCLAIDGGWVAQ